MAYLRERVRIMAVLFDDLDGIQGGSPLRRTLREKNLMRKGRSAGTLRSNLVRRGRSASTLRRKFVRKGWIAGREDLFPGDITDEYEGEDEQQRTQGRRHPAWDAAPPLDGRGRRGRETGGRSRRQTKRPLPGYPPCPKSRCHTGRTALQAGAPEASPPRISWDSSSLRPPPSVSYRMTGRRGHPAEGRRRGLASSFLLHSRSLPIGPRRRGQWRKAGHARMEEGPRKGGDAGEVNADKTPWPRVPRSSWATAPLTG